MRKILLGAVALASLSAPAFAQKVETGSPFTVTLGGSVRYDFAFFDDDLSNVSRESEIDTRLTLKAEAKADNGLVYGFAARVRPNTPGVKTFDHAYIYAQGAFGEVQLGDYVGVATQLEVVAPTVGIGQADAEPFLNPGNASLYWATEDTPYTRATYVSPSFAGFQVGVSYAPERDQGRTISKGVGFAGASDNYSDVTEFAALYSKTYDDVTYRVGGGYEFAARRNGVGQYEVWNAGATVGFAGFTFGGNYFDNGETLRNKGDDVSGWALGLTYEGDDWGIGTSYTRVRTDLAGAGGRATDQIYAFGGTYSLAPGLALQSDIAFVDANSVNNDGTQLTVRTRVDF